MSVYLISKLDNNIMFSEIKILAPLTEWWPPKMMMIIMCDHTGLGAEEEHLLLTTITRDS